MVVVSAVALSEKVPDPELRPHSFTLRVGELLDLDDVGHDLVAAGYERVDQVDDRGQFAIRGGLLDVFPATEDRAVRVDLFDIEIEGLRYFSTFTQRSLGDTQEVEIAPAAELAAEHREMAEIAALEDSDSRPDVAELLPVDRFHAFLDLAPAGAAVILAAEEEVAPALADHWQDVCAAFHDADAHHLYVNPEAITAALDERARIRLSSIASDQRLEFRAQAADVAARSLRDAEPELEKLVRSDYRTVVAWPRRGDGERAAYNLSRLRATWLNGERPPAEHLGFAQATLRDGFVAAGLRLAVIPEHRLFRRRRAERQPPPSRGRRGVLRSFADLRTGDIVVHEDHGLARFAGFETKTVAEVTRDYLQLEFAGTDRVFMPVDQLAKITRYVGAGGAHPALSKLGGKAWETLKARARRAAQELAGELINLYAERRRRPGHGFPEDSEWLREFEGAFPWQETPDQHDAIEAVKADMERDQPMDRLICGDVGYGKTEVALRAAFKAAEDGKQVLVLAPTTILAQQHFGTFAERLKDYPFTIEHVSRFRYAQAAARVGDRVQRGPRRHPDRHPSAARPRPSRQGHRADRRRRGTALRGQAEGAAAPAQAQGRRHRHERHADPAHAADVAGRPARHQRHRDAARGPAAGQDLRRRVRRGARQAGAPAREGARRTGLLRPQPGRDDRRDGRAPARPVPGHQLRGRPRPARREAARVADDELPARRVRRARGHEHHRVGHRHPAGQHADRRARRHLRPGPALPDPRSRRPQP